MIRRLYVVVTMLVFISCKSAQADEGNALPTHCKSGEFAYLNARMARIEYSRNGYELIKNGKVLSICADRKEEPFGVVVYRYGKIGEVELEQAATRSNRLNVFSVEGGVVGNNILYFTKGEYSYCISEATNQGHGVHLLVYKSGRKVLNLFSGNESGIDYESGLIGLNFEKPISPILRRHKPRHIVW